jgi:hypothetical protein
LINSLCVNDDIQREKTCRLQLSLQPRFIARYNQLVAHSSQQWESKRDGQRVRVGEEHHDEDLDQEEERIDEDEEDEMVHEGEIEGEVPYVPYEEDYDAEEAEEELQVLGSLAPETQSPTLDEVVEVDPQGELEGLEAALEEAEEDELYEENEEAYDLMVQSPEALVNEMDEEQRDEEQQDEEQHDEDQNEDQQNEEQQDEEHPDEQLAEVDIEEQVEGTMPAPAEGILPCSGGLTSADSTNVHDDEDDLISYEEAVDQTDEGQDYRQQYIEETIITHSTNGDTIAHSEDVPSPGSPGSKRPMDEEAEQPRMSSTEVD